MEPEYYLWCWSFQQSGTNSDIAVEVLDHHLISDNGQHTAFAFGHVFLLERPLSGHLTCSDSTHYKSPTLYASDIFHWTTALQRHCLITIIGYLPCFCTLKCWALCLHVFLSCISFLVFCILCDVCVSLSVCLCLVSPVLLSPVWRLSVPVYIVFIPCPRRVRFHYKVSLIVAWSMSVQPIAPPAGDGSLPPSPEPSLGLPMP